MGKIVADINAAMETGDIWGDRQTNWAVIACYERKAIYQNQKAASS